MKDLKTKTTRSHEMRDGELIVIRRQTGMNGSDREVSVITEEKGITMKDVSEVLEQVVPRELEKSDREISKLEKEFDEIKMDIEKFENDPDFVKFYEFNEKKETGVFFELMKLSPEAQEKIGLPRDREFQKFRKYVTGPKIKELSSNLKRMNEMAQKEGQLDEAKERREDILNWKKQFEEIKETLQK